MKQLIGLKELQQNTRKVREDVARGMHFIVVYRSKPIFEIKPIESGMNFSEDLHTTGLYSDDFIERMKEAEEDISKKRVKKYSPKDFLNSL